MDDIIYGLLIVAWVAYGIYSAAKKNKAKSNSPTASTPASKQQKNPLESVFESLFQRSSPDPLATSQPYSQSDYSDERIDYENYVDKVEEDEDNDYLDPVPEPVLESNIDTYSGTDNVQQAIVIDDEFNEIKNSAIDSNNLTLNDAESYAFDLRQGIIAQAILDRPYK
ncbi:MAG: hypothetical protein PF484_05075 [Bacteroidales bacterium]|jgi:hypothetical protein|nr:hypothetical protein [Bacteroidales bacterium]